MKTARTQGRLVVEALKRRPMTYLDMIRLGAGLSPWKRAKEAMRHYPEWQIVTATRKRDGLVTWRVVRASCS